MIKTFASKEPKKLFQRIPSRKLPTDIQRIASRKLNTLDAADHLSDLRVPPSIHLKKLSGKRAGQHSIRINDQWQICFTWDKGDAYHVEIVDYR